MSNTHFTIDIGICTFQRESVTITLASLAGLEPLDGCTLRVIVADNDETPSAQTLVAATAADFGLTITYVHAPARNISIARNACLDAASADYLAFIDDDEILNPAWLREIMHVARETEAEATLGPVKAIYGDTAPRWMAAGDFHSTGPTYVNGSIATGYAGNVVLRHNAPALSGLRFDEALGVTGGEDTDFFTRLTAASGRIVFAQNALAYEPVPPHRATLRWLLQRRLRYGHTHARILKNEGKKPGVAIATALVKTTVCYMMVLPNLFSAVRRTQWLLRGTLHLGVVQALRQSKP